MKSIAAYVLLAGRVVLGAAVPALLQPQTRSQDDDLGRILSKGATITHDASAVPRWSDYNAPTPGIVVNVATERDVQATVQWARKHKKPFFAQSGGHGWINSLKLGDDGVLINMRGLNSIVVAPDRKTAKVGGGTLVSEAVQAAYDAHVHIVTGNCNCVGMLGAALGGGYGNLIGLYGFSVDNIISVNVVLADGRMLTVDPNCKDKDLFWALRGAGPNFGIVTSAVYKAYPVEQAKDQAWLGPIFFNPSKLEQVVSAIEKLVLQPKMNVFMYLVTDPSSGQPVVLVTPFYYGTEAEGRAAFKSILDIGPDADLTKQLPHNQWNAGADGFCVKGQRKPGSAAGFAHMDPATWRQIYNAFADFVKLPGAANTAILVECYSLQQAQQHPTAASFPGRDIRFNAAVLPWYADAALDTQAEAFSSKVRDLWRSTDGYNTNRTYVNFAHGDEPSSVVYQQSATRLKQLKRTYDPQNLFSHWFSLA